MLISKQLRKIIEKEQTGIFNRYLQEKDNWEEHLYKTKEFIQLELESCKYNSVAILGSGWLLDLPMDFLIQKFEKIMLVDIVHPNAIQNKYKKYSNVEFIEFDLSAKFQSILEKNEQETLLDWPFQADVVISVNLLSQLVELPQDYMKLDFDLLLFAEIQSNHIHNLKKCEKFILISDIIEHQHLGAEIRDIMLVYCEIPLCMKKKEWTWNFDNSGKYFDKADKVEKTVFAFAN